MGVYHCINREKYKPRMGVYHCRTKRLGVSVGTNNFWWGRGRESLDSSYMIKCLRPRMTNSPQLSLPHNVICSFPVFSPFVWYLMYFTSWQKDFHQPIGHLQIGHDCSIQPIVMQRSYDSCTIWWHFLSAVSWHGAVACQSAPQKHLGPRWCHIHGCHIKIQACRMQIIPPLLFMSSRYWWNWNHVRKNELL